MKKKILSCMLVISLVLSLFSGIDITSITANAVEIHRWGDYEYFISHDNTVVLTSYLGKSFEVTVPSEIDGIPVTKINNYCFSSIAYTDSSFTDTRNHPNIRTTKRITKVTIPSSVKTIGDCAFYEAELLVDITFSEGLEEIGKHAFARCYDLKEVKLPDSLKNFTLYAFEETSIEEIVLGPNVKNPEMRDFQKSSIKRLVFNADILDLGKVQLNSFSVLEEIVCNGSFAGGDFSDNNIKRIVCNGDVVYSVIASMASDGFYFNCDSDGNNKVFTSTQEETENIYQSGDYKYYLNEKSEAVITEYTGTEEDVKIPSQLDGHTVTKLAPLSFSKVRNHNAINRNSVTIPDTVEKIGTYAFAYNTSLKKIKLPSELEIIPAECFVNCKALEKIEFPENITEIHNMAFMDCEALENFSFPKNLQLLGDYSFYNCETITNLSFPESLKKIGLCAFKNCKNLKSVDMSHIEETGKYAFYSCRKLDEIKFSEKLKVIGSCTFSGCGIGGTIDLSAVEELGADAFSSCKITTVILNDSMTRLETGTFQFCTELKEINIPSQLEYIGDYCFRSTKIETAIFGDKLKVIGALSFENCKNLREIKLPDCIEKIGNFAFQFTSISTLTIPENLSVLGYSAFGDCKMLEVLYFNAKNCTIDNYLGFATELDLENLINSSPFYGCNIKEIHLGEGITSIGGTTDAYGSFENCTELESIIIPDTVSEIGNASFKNCTSLETAIISDSVTSVSDDAFEGCEKLTIVCFENSYIHKYAQNKGIAVSTFLVSPIPNQTYTGEKITPEVSVTFSGNTLDRYIDFGVTYANNINVGEAEVTVKGKGDYRNFSNKTKFTIVTKDISSATIVSIENQAFTGNEITPEIVVKDSSVILCKDKDYTLSYSNNKNEGTATVTVTGKGNYSGSISAEFQIVNMSDSESFFTKIISWIKTFVIKVIAFFENIIYTIF